MIPGTMKIIRGVLWGCLAVVLIASVGIFIFFETFDTDVYLSKFTAQASKVLGRSVMIGHAGLGLSLRGVTLDVGPLVIADDESFSSLPFVKIDSVHLGLDIMSLITEHKLRITNVLIQSPVIHILRSQERIMNVQSLGRHAEAIGRSGTVASPPGNIVIPAKATAKVGQAGVLIKSIKIQDASVSYIDQDDSLPLDIWVSDINAAADDLSFIPGQMSFNLSELSLTIGVVKFYTHLAKDDRMTGIMHLHLTGLQTLASGAVTGDGDVLLSDVVIENFNIAQALLSRTLGSFSGIFESLDHLIDGALNGKAGFSFHDGSVVVEDAWLKTSSFELTAKGAVKPDLNTSLQTVLRLDGSVCVPLAAKVKMVEYLMDDHKSISIPAELSGIFPHLEYKMDKDFRKKIKKAFKKEGAAQVINDVLSNFLR